MKGSEKINYLKAVVLCVVLIATSASVLGGSEATTNDTSVPMVHLNEPSITESMTVSAVYKPVQMKNTQTVASKGTDIQVTMLPEVENNPAIAAEPAGNLLLAYTFEQDIADNNIIYSFSTDGGQNFDPGTYFNVMGLQSHPSLDYRGVGRQVVGTFQGDPFESNGAIQYLFHCADLLDYNSYELLSWDWAASFPYSDRLIPDMGGYNYPGIDWWYGMTACVGTRASPGSVNMPIFNYMDYVSSTQGWSKYFATYSGCENVAVDIDQTNGLFYAVFDYLNPASSSWDLLLFRGDCQNDGSGSATFFGQTILGGAENTKYPAVAVNDNKVVILAESDSAGNNDIICYYSTNAGLNWQMSVVASSVDDETSPRLVTYGDDITATFMMNGNLYVTYSEDAGVTWSTATQVNDEDTMVQPGFRNSDITFGGTVVWTDLRNGNPDIYLDNVGGTPAFPIISFGDFKGGLGKVSIPVKNIGDKDATNIEVTLTVTGGLLGRINTTKTETISLAVNDEYTITTDGFMFGLGSIQLSATAICVDALPPTVSKTQAAKILLLFIRLPN